MKLQILVPQYKETEGIIKPLLDSIAIQQNINFQEDIGVVIVNDGSDTHLSNDFLKSYNYPIEYHLAEHAGVSATRNACFDYATADYVMWCDADDMFYNACGMWIILDQIKHGFDILVSSFIEETRHPVTKEVVYFPHEMDSTFVHGKVFNREFLLKNQIQWNPKLTIHEDSYFNILAQKCCDLNHSIYCGTPFYLWKWRDESVCRHDPKYILKTFNNMLDSSTALVLQLLARSKQSDAAAVAFQMVYDTYFTMNKDEWINQENQSYRRATERRFKDYYLSFKMLLDSIPQEVQFQILQGLRNRMYSEGLLLESITFNDWIKKVMEEY